MNKKGNITNLIFYSMFGVIIILLSIFGAMFMFYTFNDYVIEPVVNTTNSDLSHLYNSDFNATINQLGTTYDQTNFYFDLFFLLGWITMFIGSIAIAIREREQETFIFFGYLTMFMLIFLLSLTYIQTLQDWLVLNLFEGILNIYIVDYPIMNFYLDNMQYIHFFWAVLLLVLNKLDFNIITGTGRGRSQV